MPPSQYADKWHGVPFPPALEQVWYTTFKRWPLQACLAGTRFLMAVGAASPAKMASAFVPAALINWAQRRRGEADAAPARATKRLRVQDLVELVNQLPPAQREAFDAGLQQADDADD